MANGPFTRIYHVLADDYPEVYDSPLLADFTRLLVAADQSYPTRPKWIGHASARAMTQLSAIGAQDGRGALIARDGSRYSVKGIEKERGMRAEKARHAARIRWPDAPSNASGSANGNASSNAQSNARDEKSRDEKSRDEKSRGASMAFGLG